MFTAILAKRGNGIHKRAPDHHKIGTACQRLDDIQTGLNAAINDKRKLSANDRADCADALQRVRRGIQLTTTMVGDDKPVNAHPNRTLGILTVQNTFQQHLAGPGGTNVLKIVPVQRAIQLLSDE